MAETRDDPGSITSLILGIHLILGVHVGTRL